jgi:uncharacterized Fe-S cluster-containing radical SAM superfamily enzyme
VSKLTFQDLAFSARKDAVRVKFLKIFYFDIPKDQLAGIGPYKLESHSIEFPGMDETRARNLFSHILNGGFQRLGNGMDGKPTIYIYRNSGIPLIGNVGFGIIDRNTTLIEVKPITGCNLKCIYCSVDDSKRSHDFVVEEAYLVDELRKLIDFKQANKLEIHINAHGEPLHYEPLADFVSHISNWPEIRTISIDTNATMLTKKKVDRLVKAGLNQFNVSLNALDQRLADRIAGARYPLEKVKTICRYVARKANLLIAPVLIPGINENEIPKLIEFAKSLNARIGIQNFLNYRFGRNPVKAWTMESFLGYMRELERRYDLKIVLDEGDFDIRKTRTLPKPFRKGERVTATALCLGRMEKEMIAVAKGRSIAVANCTKKGAIRIRITRDKHNIYYGVLA